jgi:hypothetical protein
MPILGLELHFCHVRPSQIAYIFATLAEVVRPSQIAYIFATLAEVAVRIYDPAWQRDGKR